MAGIFEQLIRPKRQGLFVPQRRMDPSIMELCTAKEILQEVFGTSKADVEEMIRARVDELREMR